MACQDLHDNTCSTRYLEQDMYDILYKAICV